MCQVVYLASSKPLRLIPFADGAQGISVTAAEDDIDMLRLKLSLPYVYCVGAYHGCGCGFCFGETPEYEDEEIAGVARASRARLAAYLQEQLERECQLEMYVCWMGEESKPIECRSKIKPSALLKERTFFEDREFIEVMELVHD